MIKLRTFITCLILVFALPVFAQEKTDIYTVAVPVENPSEPQRQAAFLVALNEVVALLSVNPNVKAKTNLSELFDHPELYVESFSYQSDPEQEDALNIIVHFDREALNQFFPQQHVSQSQNLNLQISGVTSALELNAMTHDLSQMNTIKALTIEQVKGEDVLLSVILRGNVASFIQTLLADQRFVSLSAEDSQDQSGLRFKWMGE